MVESYCYKGKELPHMPNNTMSHPHNTARPLHNHHLQHGTLSHPERQWKSPYAEMLLDSSDGSTTYNSPAHRSLHSAASSTSTTTQEVWVKQKEEESFAAAVFNKPVAWIWMLLSMAAFAVSAFALLQPFWLINSDTHSSLGIVNFCTGEYSAQDDEQICNYFDGTFSVTSLPGVSWKVTLVLYMTACGLLAVGGLLAAICICVSTMSKKRNMSFVAGYFQLFAVILLITSLVVYPVGLDASEVKVVCETSGIFNLGKCYVGWSYALATTSAALCCLLPVLSHYIDYPLCQSNPLTVA